MVLAFINRVRPVINAGFKWNTEKMTEMNSATSYIMKRAVIDTEEELSIDFPSVLVSRGDLLKPSEAKAVSDSPGCITFSWADNSEAAGANPGDRALILAYNAPLEQAVYVAGEGPHRRDKEFTLEVSATFSGESMETYLAFVSADGEEASDSVYLGSVEVE